MKQKTQLTAFFARFLGRRQIAIVLSRPPLAVSCCTGRFHSNRYSEPKPDLAPQRSNQLNPCYGLQSCCDLRNIAEICGISKILVDQSYRHAYVVEEHSRRTAELVVNHSRRFYEFPRSIDTLCSISRRTANPEKRKIGEPRIRL